MRGHFFLHHFIRRPDDDALQFHGRRGRHDHFGGDVFDGGSGLRGGGRRGGERMLGHGDLKLLLLGLIEQQPCHGYELIRTIEALFQGHYTPSPGAIYPTLTLLEELGHAEVDNDQGSRKRYAITDAGRTFLDENREAVEAITERARHSVRLLAKRDIPPAVRKAMHALKHALLMRGSDWNKAEAQRVAAIIEGAAAEIATGRHHEQ